jgi:ABC-type antimicrobial peptide transport system permease subunit
MNRTVDDITYAYEEVADDKYAYTAEMSRATYDAIFGEDVYQVSIFASSDVGVDAIIRRFGSIRDGLLSGPKYKVFYPYDSQTTESYLQLYILLNVFSASLTFAFTLFAATAITYIIFRAIINTKMRDYAIFRTIGASQGMIKTFIYLENIFTASMAFVIVLGALLTMNETVPILSDVLKYYNVFSYISLFFILIVMALLISGKYCRRVFRESVQRTLKAE